jgi:dienelactone hydrolase
MGATVPAYLSALERWVRKGYVVAAPAFPLSSGTAPGGPSLVDYQEQPADVSFVLDRMLRLTRRDRRGLRNTISETRIGAAGHSLGALTTLAVVGNSCCVDRRVDAAVAWAGLQLPFTGGVYFSRPTPPLLLIHGTADPTYPASVEIYAQASAPKAFMTLVNGPHIPNIPPWVDPTVNSTVDFFDGFLKRDRTAFKRLTVDANVAGAASLQATGLPYCDQVARGDGADHARQDQHASRTRPAQIQHAPIEPRVQRTEDAEVARTAQKRCRAGASAG